MGNSLVLVEQDTDARIATVTLNRPEKRNALTVEMVQQLNDVWAELLGNDAITVVILTAADPAFCAGMDLNAMDFGASNAGFQFIDAQMEDDGDGGSPLSRAKTPCIGAVNGAAITGGLELALDCDFLIASDRATFADTHVKLGVPSGGNAGSELPKRIGAARAKEMSLTGRIVSAQEAYDWGLVNRVVPHEDLLPHVRGLAQQIAGHDRATVLGIKALADENYQLTPEQAVRNERRRLREFLARAAQGGGTDRTE